MPTASAEVVAHLEARLDLSEEPDEPTRPRVCIDAQPCQWLADSRPQQPVAPGDPARLDYAYTRPGTCTRCSMVAPWQRWWHLTVPPRRPKRELAHWMAALGDGHVPEAERIRVVFDHLRTHTPAARYEVCPPAAARRMRRQLEFHPTPVHGSWLPIAAIALAVLARQCLHRRIAAVPG